jgi:hypothetical protein
MTARAGIGLDAQYRDAYPGGIEGLCAALRPRLSHLSIVSLRNVDAAARFRIECAGELPVIHHLSGIEPARPTGPDSARYAVLDRISTTLGASWAGEDIAYWSLGGNALPYFLPPLLTAEAAARAAAGIRELQRRGSVPFLAEIPSFTVVAGTLGLGEYFRLLALEGGCELVADVAHVYSYAVATGRDPLAVFRTLPLDSVREVHVAGGHIDPVCPRRYVDTHSEPILEPVLKLVSEAATSCPHLEAVTFEVGVGLDRKQIIDDLGRVEEVLASAGWTPRIARRS